MPTPRGVLAAVIIVLAALIALSAHAHESSAPFASWFNSLKMPIARSGMSIGCCGPQDCANTEARLTYQGWQALWHKPDGGEEWVDIPPNHILVNQENPTGAPVLCITADGFVRCFVPGDMT